jgi:hypothetical protein
MGGGGGSRTLKPGEIRRLERLARESLKEAAGQGRRNVFISFASEDLREVNLLRGQAKNEFTDIEFNDWSVKDPFDSENAEYIRRRIREQIRQSSVTAVYVSKHTPQSRWVDWEIRESLAQGKGVVAVHSGDTPPPRLPRGVTENGIPVVPWSELSQGIERAAQRAERLKPGGKKGL